MTFSRPIVLAIFPVAAALVVMSLRGRGYDRRRMVWLGILRMLFVSAAILAAAGTTVRLPSPSRHVVFLVDESPSCVNRLDKALELVDERIAGLDETDTAVVLRFSGHVRRGDVAATVQRPDEATNIEAALDAAAAAIPTGHPGAVFLLTDGLGTRGDVDRAAARLALRRIPVYVPRPSAETPHDVRVVAVDAPSVVAKHAPFTVTCRIEATHAATARLEVTRDGTPVLTRQIDVDPAAPTVVPILQKLDAEKLHVYSVRVAATNDTFTRNNHLAAPVLVGGKPLIVSLARGRAVLDGLIAWQQRYRLRTLSSAEELTAPLLAEASLVILDNFPAKQLGTRNRDVARFVEHSGGGLLMIGGAGSFGVGGYAGTAIDRVLPVHCDPRDAQKRPLALAVVLDSSGSMAEAGGRKMEIAREAALRTLAHLGKKDEACVIAFSVAPRTVVPLGTVADAGDVVKRLAQISPHGGTNIFPALAHALDALRASRQPLRHVVVFSDGKSMPGDADALARDYTTAGVTLSAVATGSDADRGVLSGIALGTGGRFYAATSIRQLPDIFLDDLRRIDGPLVRTGTLKLETEQPGDLLKGIDLSALPTVGAYNRVRSREGAVVHLKHVVNDQAEPVLATRRAGLGASAAVTTGFGGSWIGTFLEWEHWGATLNRVLEATRRKDVPEDFDLDVRRDGGSFRMLVTAAKAPAPGLRSDVSVRLASVSEGTVDVALTRTGARTWEGEAETDMEDVVAATLVETTATSRRTPVVRYVAASYPNEYRRLRPQWATLQRITRLTGGRVVENLDDFRTAGGHPPRRLRTLRSWLIGLALVCFFAEIVGRAVGWV